MHKRQQQQQNVLRLTSNQSPQIIRLPNGQIIPLAPTNAFIGQQATAPTVIATQRQLIQNSSVPGAMVQLQRPQNISSMQVLRAQNVAANRQMTANRVQPSLTAMTQQPRQIIIQNQRLQLTTDQLTVVPKPPLVSQAVPRMTAPAVIVRPSSPHPQVVQTLLKQDQPADATPAPNIQIQHSNPQRSLDEIKLNASKCMTFLKSLVTESSQKSSEIGKFMNVLSRLLLSGKLTEEQFVERLKEKNSGVVTNELVSFLKSSIPDVRRILAATAQTAANNAAVKTEPEKPVVVVQSTSLASHTINPSVVASPNVQQVQGQVLLQVQSNANGIVAVKGGSKALQPPLQPIVLNTNLQNQQILQNSAATPTVQLLKGVKRKHEVVENDEDINDVTTMAGVNLKEEAINVVPALSFISLKDRKIVEESYLDLDRLKSRMEKLLKKQDLAFSPESLLILSQAAREMQANVLSSLGRYAAHRLTIYKNDDKYTATSNVRRQIKFVQEVNQVTSRRDDSKSAGITEKKEVSKSTINIDESNNAALQAIGSKRSKIASTGLTFRSSLLTQPRSKRASMKDMVYALEDYKYLRSNKAYYKACMMK